MSETAESRKITSNQNSLLEAIIYWFTTSTREKSFIECITLYKSVSILKIEKSFITSFSSTDLFEDLYNKSQHSHKGKYIKLIQWQ